MQSTQKQVNPPVDRTSSPAAVLRHAAIYLWRYGWTFDGFYHRHHDDDPVAFPPACVAGAIRCVVFGRPIESIHDTATPHDSHNVALIIAAQRALADEVDPEWSHTSPCQDLNTCSLEVISDWNDVEGRTITDVLIALYSAADDWDRLHPIQPSAARS